MKNTIHKILIRDDSYNQAGQTMMGGTPIDYAHLVPGYRFPPVSIQLQSAMVTEYLRAVRGSDYCYERVLTTDGMEAVPPTAAGVLAMRSLFGLISLPEGSIHVSQEFDFKGVMAIGDTVTCQAEVARKQERGSIRLLTIDIFISNMMGIEVMTGRTVMTVPPDALMP